jgi:hypothetical protein
MRMACVIPIAAKFAIILLLRNDVVLHTCVYVCLYACMYVYTYVTSINKRTYVFMYECVC